MDINPPDALVEQLENLELLEHRCKATKPVVRCLKSERVEMEIVRTHRVMVRDASQESDTEQDNEEEDESSSGDEFNIRSVG
eukprot:Pgem_evm1s17706